MGQKQLTSLLIIICSVNLCLGFQADSVLYNVGNDSTKTEALIKLAWEYKHKDPSKSIEYAKEALTLAKNSNNTKQQAEALNQLGIGYAITGEYPTALTYFIENIKQRENMGDKPGLAQGYNNIGNILQLQKEYEAAEPYFLKGLNIRQTLADTLEMMSSLNSVALLYKEWGKFEKSLQYFFQMSELARNSGNLARESIAANNTGLVYRNMKDYDSALTFFNRALQLKEQLNDPQGIALSLRNIGDVYHETNNNQKALKYYLKSVAIREEIDYQFGLTILYRDIAELYAVDENYSKALEFAQKSIATARQASMKPEEKDAYLVLSKIYRLQGDHKSALVAFEKYYELTDSLFNEEKSQQLAELRTQFETEQKERDLKIKAEEISFLTLQNKTNQKITILLVAILILSFALLIAVFNRYKIKLRSSRLLNEKNIQIKKQNDEIEAINDELEQKFLRTQMDPHFIFNSLNSIQYFITSDNKKEALYYLAQFSKLVRQVLDNSIFHTVTLAQELKLLQIYLDLEALRFGENFKYKINIADNIDIENTEAPFFMIQPYVENAIKHGFKGISRQALIKINIFPENGFLMCVVEDNGIGRNAAAKHGKLRGHVSRGLSISKKRLELMNRKSSIKTTVEIKDLYDETNQSTGTKVEIKIPHVTMESSLKKELQG